MTDEPPELLLGPGRRVLTGGSFVFLSFAYHFLDNFVTGQFTHYERPIPLNQRSQRPDCETGYFPALLQPSFGRFTRTLTKGNESFTQALKSEVGTVFREQCPALGNQFADSGAANFHFSSSGWFLIGHESCAVAYVDNLAIHTKW